MFKCNIQAEWNIHSPYFKENILVYYCQLTAERGLSWPGSPLTHPGGGAQHHPALGALVLHQLARGEGRLVRGEDDRVGRKPWEPTHTASIWNNLKKLFKSMISSLSGAVIGKYFWATSSVVAHKTLKSIKSTFRFSNKSLQYLMCSGLYCGPLFGAPEPYISMYSGLITSGTG